MNWTRSSSNEADPGTVNSHDLPLPELWTAETDTVGPACCPSTRRLNCGSPMVLIAGDTNADYRVLRRLSEGTVMTAAVAESVPP